MYHLNGPQNSLTAPQNNDYSTDETMMSSNYPVTNVEKFTELLFSDKTN